MSDADVMSMNNKKINALALIVGVMKCGTTSVFRYLRQHPQICPCSTKEPGFFSNDRTFAKGLGWYYRLWDWDPSIHTWALEASTEYTHPKLASEIARRIADTGADVRILCVVRDPIKRIESQYNHAYSAGWIDREVKIDDLVEKRPQFIERSRYATQLDPYRETFGADRLLVINASDLSATPDEEMNRAVDFLGLAPHSFAGLSRTHNPGRGRIVENKMITSIRRNPALFEALQRFVPAALQQRVRQAVGTRLTRPFELSAESRARILELLVDDLGRLQSEYGVDITKWGVGGVRSPAERSGIEV